MHYAFMTLFLVVGSATAYSAYIWKIRYLFFYKITDGLCISQVYMTDTYDIVDCRTKKIIVSNVFDWIIDNSYTYGSLNNHKFFIFNLSSGDPVLLYNDFSDFQSELTKQKLQPYDLGKAENVVHLKFSNGRNRVYPQAKKL